MIYHGDQISGKSTFSVSYPSLTDLPAEIRRVTRALKNHVDEFDGIVVTGTSGLLIGPAVSVRLNKALLVVRKSDDNNHSNHVLVGADDLLHKGSQRYVFLDDFVSTGATQRRVEKAMENHNNDSDFANLELVARYESSNYTWLSFVNECDSDFV